MADHFELGPNDWKSDKSRRFADLLLRSDASTRDKICLLYGLRLSIDAKGTRIDYGGQRVGIGGFATATGKVTFSILPKVEELDVKILFDALQHYRLTESVIQFDAVHEMNTGEHEGENLSWTYLMGLLQNIHDFSAHNFLVFNTKKKVRLTGALRGRPIAKTLVHNLAIGYFGVDCEVLDNYKQRQFASLFLETAKHLAHDLDEWNSILKYSSYSPVQHLRAIKAKLKPHADIPFSPSLLTALACPPYPYGVRTLFKQCLQYWRWKGIYSDNNSRQVNSFWSVSLSLDDAFETYAGHILQSSLSLEKEPKRRYRYSTKLEDARLFGAGDRFIEPDHIFTDLTKKILLIGEAKYSNKLMAREHVSQLISYLKYDGYSFAEEFSKLGVLIYPGNELKLEKINNFGENLFLLTLPINANFAPQQKLIPQILGLTVA